MRHIQLVGNPLQDRFDSLQRRNLIETRSLKRYNRRYALKVKEKRSHREFEQEQAKQYKDIQAPSHNPNHSS